MRIPAVLARSTVFTTVTFAPETHSSARAVGILRRKRQIDGESAKSG
jgi:hypothetical protein